jgi:glycosyltransferase involved in cell wall biosynthesis
VIAISESTATDLQTYFRIDSRKIRVIYQGVEQNIQWMTPQEKLAARRRWNLPERFLLYVGTLSVYKNVLNLIKALLNISDPDLGIVIVGKHGDQAFEIEAFLRQCPAKRRIQLLGYLAQEELEALYQLATVFVFPSRHEGFGLPVLEAMKRRLPVVTSNNSSLQELFHDSAILVNPEEPNEIASGIELVLNDERCRTSLIQRGEQKAQLFTWKKTADQTSAAYQELM